MREECVARAAETGLGVSRVSLDVYKHMMAITSGNLEFQQHFDTSTSTTTRPSIGDDAVYYYTNGTCLVSHRSPPITPLLKLHDRP
jgi:hypothetical protein